MATFTEHLRARGETGLAALLRERPDLSVPPPPSVRSLAARAANRASLDRALAGVDALVLACLEGVLGLEGTAVPGGTGGPDVVALARAMGHEPGALAGPVRTALSRALLWTDPAAGDVASAEAAGALSGLGLHAAPGLLEVLGPYPAGLGPPLTWSLARRTPQTLARIADEVGAVAEPAGDQDALVVALAARLADPAVVLPLLEQAPAGARPVLDALTWGPPVGRAPSASPTGPPGPARAAVDWLLKHGLLAVGDPQHVVLPREVALVLRDGRTHQRTPAPPPLLGRAVDPATVAAESARQAQEAVRLVTALVDHWGAEQPAVLRSGGLGTRELRRLATWLAVPETTAALVVELAGSAGLVADDGEESATLAPTTDADDWLRRPAPERWSAVVRAWLVSDRAAWLVGTRDDRGGLRSALDPDLRRPWAPRLRLAVLGTLAEAGPADDPRSVDGEVVHEVLAWRAPRATPPVHAVEAVLAEAAFLGITAAGVVSPAGRTLLAWADGAATDQDEVAAALMAQLPPAVEEVLLQGDLTGVVPGRPSDELAELLERASEVESRGAAVTVRFTETSVRSALDGGLTAEELLAQLSRHARSGVPQPLEYLVLDTARRHGQVRVGMASSYLRADDPTLLAGLVEDRTLRALGLLRLAPTVIAAQAPVPAVLAALRERGLAPVAEDPSGAIVLLAAAPRRIGLRTARRAGALVARSDAGPQVGPVADDAQRRRLARLARDLLAADRRDEALLHQPPVAGPPHGGGAAPWGTADPVLALAMLREAAAEGRDVWLDMIGADGGPVRRRVRPLRVDGGRVRAVDAERESELTVAVHRIAGVSPV
jgi:hypothetical protein